MDARALNRALAAVLLPLLAGVARPAAAQAPGPHIVLVGDSTVTEGSGWGLGFRRLVDADVTVTNTAQNGRSSKSFRDEGHWTTALAARGDYYLIQFGHNDQPGKGPERETDPTTTFPANMARYVDDVRAIGATPILVTPLVRRTFDKAHPSRLTSTLGPWVEAVKRVAAEKQVPLVDLDAASRAFCERIGPVETAAFDLPKTDGPPDTTHLDAAGSLAFARLVVADLRRAVPALAPWLLDEPADAAAADDPAPGEPRPLELLTPPGPNGDRWPWGRVYTRSIRLAMAERLAVRDGRLFDPRALPATTTASAVLVAWDFPGHKGQIEHPGCGFAAVAPTTVSVRVQPGWTEPRDLQPIAVYTDRERIRTLLAPFERDVRRIRWLAVLDPARLRPGSYLTWRPTKACPSHESPGGTSSYQTTALIAQEDIDGWR
jgi:lysophospholipase L1-like esterase